MIFQTQELLFFSLNPHTTRAFERYVRFGSKEYQDMSVFRLIRDAYDKVHGGSVDKNFMNLRELFFFLDALSLPRLANLIIVIDQYSLPGNSEKENKQIIKELIVQYPEVKIVFLSTENDWTSLFNEFELKCSSQTEGGFCNPPDESCNINANKKVCTIKTPNIHSFSIYEMDFNMLIRGKSNLFDASNLRNTVKQDFFDQINVKSNYHKTQCSRLNKLSLVVEEEIPQAYFNAYAMYVSGYRVWPVCSCLELKKIPDWLNENKVNAKITVRDFDLQFEDYETKETDYISLHELRGIKKMYYIDNEKLKNDYGSNDEIDFEKPSQEALQKLYNCKLKIKKGIKLTQDDENSLNELINAIGLNKIIGNPLSIINQNENNNWWVRLLASFTSNTRNNTIESNVWYLDFLDYKWELYNETESTTNDTIWKRIKEVCDLIVFVSRFDNTKSPDKPKIQLSKFPRSEKNNNEREDYSMGIKLEGKFAYLRGLAKPLNGIYELYDIKEIRDDFILAKETEADIICIDRDSSGGHAVPPFIFHIADNLLFRAGKYLRENMFLLASLLAKEAMEILNGFHFMMMLKAIHLHSIAETRLIVNTMGLNEDVFTKNTKKRLDEIKKHVNRICYDNPKAKNNVLNQIFNDIRHVCEEKELFKAADVALNEMVNVRHGLIFTQKKTKS